MQRVDIDATLVSRAIGLSLETAVEGPEREETGESLILFHPMGAGMRTGL